MKTIKRYQILYLFFLSIILFPGCKKKSSDLSGDWKVIIPDTLSKTSISSICEYKNNSVWIGTNFGILVCDNGSISSITTDNGLLDNNILDIKKNSKDELIIFTSKGINRYDGVMNEVNSDGIRYTSYDYFAIDPYDNIWLLSDYPNPKALQKFNGDTCICYDPAGTVGYHGFDSESYTCVFADSKGKIWIGYYYTDIALFSVENDTIDYYYEQNKVTYYVNFFTEDSTGNIWFTSNYTNLIKYDGLNFTSYSDENVFWFLDIMADHNNDIWIVNINSIFRFHDEKWTTEYTYTESVFGEPHDDQFVKYSKILEDSKNNIWVCTDRGVIMKANN